MSEHYPDPLPPCPESRRLALAMLAVMPPGLPLPEIGYDPDGETCLDWRSDGGNEVSVSVRPNGKLCVAWISDQYGHSHGSEVMEFNGQWPEVLVEIIGIIFPQ